MIIIAMNALVSFSSNEHRVVLGSEELQFIDHDRSPTFEKHYFLRDFLPPCTPDIDNSGVFGAKRHLF